MCMCYPNQVQLELRHIPIFRKRQQQVDERTKRQRYVCVCLTRKSCFKRFLPGTPNHCQNQIVKQSCREMTRLSLLKEKLIYFLIMRERKNPSLNVELLQILAYFWIKIYLLNLYTHESRQSIKRISKKPTLIVIVRIIDRNTPSKNGDREKLDPLAHQGGGQYFQIAIKCKTQTHTTYRRKHGHRHTNSHRKKQTIGQNDGNAIQTKVQL